MPLLGMLKQEKRMPLKTAILVANATTKNGVVNTTPSVRYLLCLQATTS